MSATASSVPTEAPSDLAEERTLRTIGTTRTFNAPVALVWRMWTEPEHLVALVGAERLPRDDA